MAASVALVLVVQSVATYTSLVPIVRSIVPAAAPSTATRAPLVTGVAIDNQNGFAALTMTPFTSANAASALRAATGISLLPAFPPSARSIFSLPHIPIRPLPHHH